MHHNERLTPIRRSRRFLIRRVVLGSSAAVVLIGGGVALADPGSTGARHVSRRASEAPRQARVASVNRSLGSSFRVFMRAQQPSDTPPSDIITNDMKAAGARASLGRLMGKMSFSSHQTTECVWRARRCSPPAATPHPTSTAAAWSNSWRATHTCPLTSKRCSGFSLEHPTSKLRTATASSRLCNSATASSSWTQRQRRRRTQRSYPGKTPQASIVSLRG